WQQWKTEYETKENINSSWYKDILELVKIEELKQTISQAPKQKATGPTLISNEMLSHLSDKGLKVFLEIINTCFQFEDILKQWKQSLIYLISKKATYSGQLCHTQPITLIEHSRKILTKIITNRLSNIFSKFPILDQHNYVAVQGASTTIPITSFAHIIEDAQNNKRELWALSQDMSK